MEYVDGEDLSSLLTRIGRLPQERAVTVARQICSGLSAAHDQHHLEKGLEAFAKVGDKYGILGKGKKEIKEMYGL